MDLKQSFQTAVEFEKKGHDLYAAVAKKTKNKIIAKTFSFLAQQELLHIEAIEKYMNEQGKDVKLDPDPVASTKAFFTMTVAEFKEKTELSKDDLKAHEAGMELEKSAYEFYKKQLEETDDAEIKKFFEFMMKQENAHFELIQEAYDYIEDPVNFFAKQEHWLFEG